MESEQDEFGELYTPYPNPHVFQFHFTNSKLDTKNIISSQNKEKPTNMSQLNNGIRYENDEQIETGMMGMGGSNSIRVDINDGYRFVNLENYGTELVDEPKIRVENEREKGALVGYKAFVSEFKECYFQNNFDDHEDMDVVIGTLNNFESHPLVLELMSSPSVDDDCGDGEDGISQRALKIASDCGIGVKQDEDGDGDNDSDNGFNIIMTDEEFSRCVNDKREGMCRSGTLSNVTVRATPYDDDDDSYHLEDNSIGLGGSTKDVLHTRSNFVLPSNQTILEVNVDDLKEKSWRRPGVDLTDFFNFGLNELEWKNYRKEVKNEKKTLSMFATSASSRSRKAETSCTKMDAINKNTQDKVADDSHQRSTIPIGEAIQVEIGKAERIPSTETKTPRSSYSDTVIEITIRDDNAENEESVAEVGMGIFRNIRVDAIRPFPPDSSCYFFPVYGQLARPLDEERKGKKDRAEEGMSMGPKNLRPTQSRKPMLTYPARNNRKHESWRNRIINLIRRYGNDNSKDDGRRNKDVHARIKCRYETMEGFRRKTRHGTCVLGPRRSVRDGIPYMPNNVRFRVNENKRPRISGEGHRTKVWNGKRFRKSDSISDSDSCGMREEGEIIET